jgi:N-acetylmuramic acid 6-phosphate (MurNAc-6-P) etherase
MERRLTELRNPASRNLDRMTAKEIVSLMNCEDRKVAAAVRRELDAIARAVDRIVARMENGGRLIYVGAGSSGRIALLDASECPPTFGTPRGLVRALIAGGKKAMTQPVEGAEDQKMQGAHHRSFFQSRLSLGKNGDDCHHPPSRSGSVGGIHAPESWDFAENGLEHALYCRDGTARPWI